MLESTPHEVRQGRIASLLTPVQEAPGRWRKALDTGWIYDQLFTSSPWFKELEGCTVCSSTHGSFPSFPSTNRACRMWKWTPGPPNAVNPRSHVLRNTFGIRCHREDASAGRSVAFTRLRRSINCDTAVGGSMVTTLSRQYNGSL